MQDHNALRCVGYRVVNRQPFEHIADACLGNDDLNVDTAMKCTDLRQNDKLSVA